MDGVLFNKEKTEILKYPCAKTENGRNKDKDLFGSVPYTTSKTQMHKLIEVKHGIMRDEINHAVLSDIAHNRNPGKVQTRQNAY